MKNNKIKNYIEQIAIQKKIIEELNTTIISLEREIISLKVKNGPVFVDMCSKCGKLFFFNKAVGCCKM